MGGGDLPRWIGVGAVSGAVSVLRFQQGALALLHAIGLAARARLLLGATVFGAVLPRLVALMVVAPLKGQPAMTGLCRSPC